MPLQTKYKSHWLVGLTWSPGTISGQWLPSREMRSLDDISHTHNWHQDSILPSKVLQQRTLPTVLNNHTHPSRWNITLETPFSGVRNSIDPVPTYNISPSAITLDKYLYEYSIRPRSDDNKSYLKVVSSFTSPHYIWRSLGPFSLPCAQKWP